MSVLDESLPVWKVIGRLNEAENRRCCSFVNATDEASAYEVANRESIYASFECAYEIDVQTGLRK